MRRNPDLFPVRRGPDRGLSPFGDVDVWGPESLFSGFGTSPWQTMRRMQEDMDRIFDLFFNGQGQPGRQGAGMGLQQWSPSVDVSQTEKEWRIEADLPGVSKDNVSVDVHDHHLILRAEMRQEEQPEDGEQREYHRRERGYGRLERVFPLPQNVDEENIRCEFRDGVLTVHVPKAEAPAPQGRRVPIGDGTAQQGTALGTGRASTPDGGSSVGTARTTSGTQPEQSAQPVSGNGREQPAMAGARGGAKGGTRPRKKTGDTPS
jgi:HSP20 family protein